MVRIDYETAWFLLTSLSNSFGIETNLKPIWLTNVDCSSSGRQLRTDCDYRAPIGFVNNCVSFAGADCSML